METSVCSRSDKIWVTFLTTKFCTTVTLISRETRNNLQIPATTMINNILSSFFSLLPFFTKVLIWLVYGKGRKALFINVFTIFAACEKYFSVFYGFSF